MARSPVYTARWWALTRVHHHDGSGWLLYPLCWALTLPPAAGACLLPPNRSQLPAGSGRVFPGHFQQQNLSQRCLICCPRNLPGELVFPTLLPSPQPLCHLPSELHFPWVPYTVVLPSTDLAGILSCPCSFFSSQLSLPHKGRGGRDRDKRKEKNNKDVFSFLIVDFVWKQWDCFPWKQIHS